MYNDITPTTKRNVENEKIVKAKLHIFAPHVE